MNLPKDPPKDCSCEACVRACHGYPGWFAPGEAEQAAQLVGMRFDRFAKEYLIKDHCDDPTASGAPYVWSPRKIGVDVDEEIRSHWRQRPTGTCVFFKEGRCMIHNAKPYECRQVMACQPGSGYRNEIETKWIAAGAPLGMRPEWNDEE